MADKKYGTVAGVVQFDVNEREVGEDQTPVRDVSIRAIGTQDRWNLTLWPNFKHVEIERGDFVVADGSVSFRKKEVDGETRKYRNMSVSVLHVNGQKQTPKERETEGDDDPDTDDEPF